MVFRCCTVTLDPTFYAKNGGWIPFDVTELSIPCMKEFTEALPAVLLSLEQAEPCINDDSNLIKREFAGEEDMAKVRMLPLYSELEWFALRDKQAAKYLNLKKRDIFGAKVDSGERWGYILWFREYKESTLAMLRLREPSEDAALRGLLRAAVAEAKRSGLQKVRIWSPSRRLQDVIGIRMATRSGGLPSMLYLGEEQNVHWCLIERLGWC